MEEKWNEACELLGGKVSERGEALHCMLPDMEITFYPEIDRVLISDHRSKGLNRIDIRHVEKVIVFTDEIRVMSPKSSTKIWGRAEYVQIETDI